MKQLKKLWGDSCFDRYVFVILIAMELLMSFTFMGYLHIPPISVTIAYLPILVAACLYRPAQAVIVGLVFGAASMYKASATYVMAADAVFSPFLSGNPAGSILLSVGTRVLYGLLIGFLFLFAKRQKHCRICIGAICAVAPKLHSLLVYTAMGLLFPELGYRYDSSFHFDLDDAVFLVLCIVVVELILALYQSAAIQNLKTCINQTVNNPYVSRKMSLFFVTCESFLVFMSVFAALYFSERETYMLKQHGVAVSRAISTDLLLLQSQFLIASLSLNAILMIFLFGVYRYMSYKEYRVEMDMLTGVMGRRLFFSHCDRVQKIKNADRKKAGWFLFVDADYFKDINDTYGHAAGDTVLKAIAANLQAVVGEDGKVGRIGGDEFAVMIEEPLSQQELGQRLDQFLEKISQSLPDKKVSCSIGACQFVFPRDVRLLLEEADAMLYRAKENGRACYAMKTVENDPV